MAGRVERAAGELPNPISGRRPFLAEDAVEYRVRPIDVGRVLRCEVTAANGAYAAKDVAEGVVGHALPAEMNPAALLEELTLPKGYVYFAAKRRPLRAAERRAGALSRAVLNAERGISADLDVTVTIFRERRQADAGVGGRFCRDLRRDFRRASTPRSPRAVLVCRPVRLAGARRAISAVTYGAAVTSAGTPIASVQAIVVASAGNARYVLASTIVDSAARRVATARRSTRVANAVAPRLAVAASRE